MFEFINPKVKSIEAIELKRRLTSGENLIVIDVCEEYEYRSSHIDKSINMPLGSLKDMFMGQFSDLPKDTEFVLYCAHGVRSRNAVKQMNRLGFENAKTLNHGLVSYF